MKRLLSIALIALMAVAFAIAPAQAEWDYFANDVASVVGINAVVAPGVSGYQFIPTHLSFLTKDTSVQLYVSSPTGSSILTASTDAAGATTILLANATATDWGVATHSVYTLTTATDPNSATIVYMGQVASTASTDGTNELITVAGGQGIQTSGATLYKAARITGDLLYGTEADVTTVFFAPDLNGGVGTVAGVLAQFYPIDMLPSGRVGKDYIVTVTGNASTTTGIIYAFKGYYKSYR